MKDESASPPTVTYVEMYLLDDGATFVLVSVSGAMDTAGEDIPFVQESVSLDGMPILTFYPVRDVLTLLGQ